MPSEDAFYAAQHVRLGDVLVSGMWLWSERGHSVSHSSREGLIKFGHKKKC